MSRAITSFILLLLSVANCQAQKIPDYSLKHNMKQGGLSMEFTVLDPDKKQPSRHHSNKIYYWYKAQQVIQTQGGHAGIPLDGLFRSFYSNKQLCDQGEFHKGLKSGIWTYWNSNGTLNKQEHWKNGEQRGKQYYYDASGNLQKIVAVHRYKGKQHPDSLEWIRGRHTTITVYDSLGNKTAVERYYNGLQDGKSTYYSDTSSYSVTYDKGTARMKSPKKVKESAEKSTTAEPGTQKPSFFQKIQFWKKKDSTGKGDNGNNAQQDEKKLKKIKVREPASDEKKADEPNKKEARPKKEKQEKKAGQ